MNYREAREILNGKDSKKLRYETWLHDRGEYFAIRHFETDVIRIYPRKTVYDCDGWKSKTTKGRLNDYGPGRIYAEKGVWLASYGEKTVVYRDGITFHCNGCLTGGEDVATGKAEKALRRKIRKYSKAFVDALHNGEVGKPSEMDCFDCGMLDRGKSPNPGDSHLLSHIEESYFVPSLVVNAITAFPISEVGKATLYYTWNSSKSLNPLYHDCFSDLAWNQIEKSIRRYLYQKLGLVR